MKETKFVIIRETNWQSIVADAVTFLMIFGAMAINHFYLGDSGVWAVLLFLMVLMSISAKGRLSNKYNRFDNAKDAIEHLKTLDHAKETISTE